MGELFYKYGTGSSRGRLVQPQPNANIIRRTKRALGKYECYIGSIVSSDDVDPY